MSDISAEVAAPKAPPHLSYARDVLQALLLICVIGWVLDLPRRVLGVSFYTEQMLAISLGFGLALLYISGARVRWFDWLFEALSIAVCCYIASRY